MNHAPSEIIANLLVNANKAVFDPLQATGLKWPVFMAIVPDSPDKLITVYDTMGIKDGRLETGETIVHPGWQIMTRSLFPQSSYRMADMLFQWSDVVVNANVTMQAKTVDSMVIPLTVYQVIGLFKTGPILTAGQDEKRRFLFTLNGTTTIKQL